MKHDDAAGKLAKKIKGKRRKRDALWSQMVVAPKKEEKNKARTKLLMERVRNHVPVSGVQYRTSLATGLKRPIKPKPVRRES